jgi:hypothetical protein
LNTTDPEEVLQLLPEFQTALNNHQKQFKFYYGMDSTENNSSVEHLMINIEKYLVNYDPERRKFVRRFLIMHKFKRAVVKISKFAKQSIENAVQVSMLIREATENEEKEREEGGASVSEYVPLKHSHHYDDELSGLMYRTYHKPDSEDTKERLKELIDGNYVPPLTSNADYFSNLYQDQQETSNLVNKTTSSNVQRTVSYNPQQHMKKKRKKETGLLINISDKTEKKEDDKLMKEYDAIRKSVFDRNASKLLPYTKISFKPKEERIREEVSDRIKRRYLRRSYNQSLLENNQF